MAYDGEIRLRATLDPSGVKSSARDLRKSMQDVFDQAQGKEMNAQFVKAQLNMQKLDDQARKLLVRMSELENTKIPTQEYTDIQQQIQKAEVELSKLIDRKEKFLETGGKRSSSTFRSMEYDIENLEKTLAYAKSEMEDLVKGGQAFRLGSDSAEYQQITENLADVNDKMRIATESALQNKIFHEETVAVVDDETNSVEQLDTATEKVEKHSRGVEMNFKRILKYAFGIGSLYILANKLRTSAVEGLKNMAAMDDELNNNVSTMLTSLNQLKADIASIIQPFVDLLLPALTWVLDKLHAVAMNLAQYIAAITGQNYVKVATVQTVNWAKANERLAAASDKALGNYDKLNVINSSSGGGGGAGGGYGFGSDGGGIAYEEQQLTGLASKVLNWRNQAVETVSNVFMALDEGIHMMQESMSEKGPLGFIKDEAEWISEAAVDIMKNGLGMDWLDDYIDDMADSMEDRGVVGGFLNEFGNHLWETIEDEEGWLYKLLDAEKDKDSFWGWGDDTSGGEWTNDPVKKKELRDALEAHEKEMDELHDHYSKHFWEWAMEDESAMEQAGEEALKAYGDGLTDKSVARRIEKQIDSTTNAIAGALTSVSSFFRKGVQTGAGLNQGIGVGSEETAESTANGLNRNLQTIRDQMNPHVLDGAGEETGQNFTRSVQTGAEQEAQPTANGLNLTMESIKNMLNPNALAEEGQTIGQKFTNSVTDGIQSTASGIVDAIKSMMDGIKLGNSGSTSIFAKIGQTGRNIGDSILGGIKNVFVENSSVKDALQKFLEDSLNTTFKLTGSIGSGSAVGSSTSLLKLHAVKLAQGAVIPANREFLAMLGDQTQGTNIEAPLDTIVSAMKQALGESGGHADINLNLDGHTIAKVVWDKTEQRYKQTGRTAYGY